MDACQLWPGGRARQPETMQTEVSVRASGRELVSAAGLRRRPQAVAPRMTRHCQWCQQLGPRALLLFAAAASIGRGGINGIGAANPPAFTAPASPASVDITVISASAGTSAHHTGTWDVPCPAGKPGACFTPDFVSTKITFDPPLPKDNDSTVAVWFSGCNVGGGWKHSGCPCCGDKLAVEAKNVTANGAVLQISRGTCGGSSWGQALVVSWSAPGPPAPPPPPPAPSRTTPLSIMMFYGFNESAQCGWTTHAWQELGTPGVHQAFKKNLSVALADVVSFHSKHTRNPPAALPQNSLRLSS